MRRRTDGRGWFKEPERHSLASRGIKTAVKNNPEARVKLSISKYLSLTEEEARLIDMLQENTGRNLLDSGGAYGRHWERNQLVDFTKQKEVEWDEYGYTRNVYPFLKKNLSINIQADKYQKMYDKRYKNSEESYLSDMEDFIDYLEEQGISKSDDYIIGDKPRVINTYNGEEALSQTLQYAVFYDGNDYYVILQIHNGADVRGGYTAPKIFKVDDVDNFIIGQQDATAITKDGTMYTTDDTYHWYKDGSTASGDFEWDDIYKKGIEEMY